MVAWTISSETTYMVESCVHDVGTILTFAQNLGSYILLLLSMIYSKKNFTWIFYFTGLFEDPSDSSDIAKTVLGMYLKNNYPIQKKFPYRIRGWPKKFNFGIFRFFSNIGCNFWIYYPVF